MNLTREQRRWLFDRVEEDHGFIAVNGSDLDKKFKEFVELGAVELQDSMFGNHYYGLTKAGRNELRPR